MPTLHNAFSKCGSIGQQYSMLTMLQSLIKNMPKEYTGSLHATSSFVSSPKQQQPWEPSTKPAHPHSFKRPRKCSIGVPSTIMGCSIGRTFSAGLPSISTNTIRVISNWYQKHSYAPTLFISLRKKFVSMKCCCLLSQWSIATLSRKNLGKTINLSSTKSSLTHCWKKSSWDHFRSFQARISFKVILSSTAKVTVLLKRMKSMPNVCVALSLRKFWLSNKAKKNLSGSGSISTSSSTIVSRTAPIFISKEAWLCLLWRIFPRETFLLWTFWTGRSTDVSQLCRKN